MKKFASMIIVILGFLAMSPSSGLADSFDKPASSVPEAQALIDQAWEKQRGAWREPEISFVMQRLERANALDPGNHEILTALSIMCFRRGGADQGAISDDSKAGKPYFERGYKYAIEALEIKDSSYAHYYAAINHGAMTGLSSMFYQIYAFPGIRSHIEWIGKNDRYFLNGAYARFWCDCYQYGPDYIINVIGIEKREACKDLEKAMRLSPGYLENYFYKMRCCLPKDDKEKTLKLIGQALSADAASSEEEQEENKYYRRKLNELWLEKTGKEYPAR